MRNEHVDLIRDELSAVGVEPTSITIGKHIKVRWLHQGLTRTFIAPSTASDYRAKMNVRSDLRRLLRNDGIVRSVDERVKQQRPSQFATAMTLPDPNATLLARLTSLETEVKLLRELIIDDLSRQPPKAALPQSQAQGRRKGSRPSMISLVYDALDFNGTSLEVLASRLGVSGPRGTLSVALTQLKAEGLATNLSRGIWKKLPASPAK